MASDAPLSALWEQPHDLRDQDLFNGPWGAARAPDPEAVYTYLRPKQGGTNPGMVVQDPAGREWHVKQAPHNDHGDEGPVEVTLSRVLSAVGYHQPPVYFLPSFMMRDASGTRRVPGGRFRLHDGTMHSRGKWLWQQNPFVGTRPFQGLAGHPPGIQQLRFQEPEQLDLRRPSPRQSHGAVVCRPRSGSGARRERPTRAHPERSGAIRTPDLHHRDPRRLRDLQLSRLASGTVPRPHRARRSRVGRHLLSGLSDRQWNDAFRAGGFTPAVAGRYIRKLRANIARAQQFSNAPAAGAVERR